METNAVAAGFAQQFGAYKKAHDDAVKALAVIATKIGALHDEAEAINNAPLNCADFCELLGADIDSAARAARSNLANMALGYAMPLQKGKHHHSQGHYLTRPNFSFGGKTDGLGLAWPTLKRMVCMGDHTLVMSADEVSAMTLCGLFGDAIKKAMTESLMAREWPFEDAQPIAERLVRLKAIDDEVAKLEEEQTGLQALVAQKNSLAE